MKQRSSSTARIAAASALVLALILSMVVIGSSVGGGSSDSGKRHHSGATAHKAAKEQHVPASYEVQSGDTLTSIAHETGVPVRKIEALNPGVDPQILIAGEKIKLR
jgi:LysM repeat protein